MKRIPDFFRSPTVTIVRGDCKTYIACVGLNVPVPFPERLSFGIESGVMPLIHDSFNRIVCTDCGACYGQDWPGV